ncbi:S-layer homology domain-containing protein [Anaerotignum sp. MB30-C6]|uniref:S-layer homology domain-containing protein n=1 Tax=Anaerotignum sp. MB30-C6 TaxID=3070814 RepID=UPI0027DDF922|nr:S-layer homology domain-containing protein [Anaerotignum sp. MB30-C6]WMI82409.1 S-layer homology domain-containing protein [Anaerotignum sp. MB30-C6]
MNQKFKRTSSLLLILCLIVSMFAESAYAMHLYFEDAKGHWAEEAIQKLTEQGIVTGFPDGLCHPDETITRGEFTALLARTLKISEDKEYPASSFTDIQNHWSEDNILFLVSKDIIEESDYKNHLFKPDEAITRMEIVKMLVRALGTNCHSEDCTCNLDFTDIQLLNKEDKLYLCIGEKYYIIHGYPDKTVKPKDTATRAEAFQMLMKEEKAKDQIKKEEQNLPVVKPDEKPSHGSSSGGSSSYVPEPQFSFTLPKTMCVGESITIVPQSKYVNSVAWSASKNDLPVEFSKAFEGDLKADGGTIKAKDTGIYAITAAAENSRGTEITCKQFVSVYPVIKADFTLPNTAHTDTSIAVDLKAENLGSNSVVWTLTKDGKSAEIADSLVGEIGNSGGTVQFREKGNYTLTAAVTDEIGKVVTVSHEIMVYPVAEVKLNLPNVTHTDKTIILATEIKNNDDLSPSWSLTKDGKEVEIAKYIKGNLTLSDSEIGFTEKGVYQLTITLTDKAGRKFTDTVKVMVYPVGSVGFYLPTILHTDDTVKAETTLGEIGDKTAIWTLSKDGQKVALADCISGSLTNDGGNIRFKEKGNYVLTASFTDDGGRSYSYEQNVKVYPVPTVTYLVPKYAHTDTEIEITVTSTDLDVLTLEWLVDNTFGYQDWNTFVNGKLNNNGGSIYFKRAGIYELVCRVTDETGRVFLFEPKKTTEVLPVLAIGFELPNAAYTDTEIDLRTSGHNNTLPVEWAVTKNGEKKSLETVLDGNLNALGGKVRFKEYGEFVLTVDMTDFLGRKYSHSESITILPVLDFGFIMPNEIHYGMEFDVKVNKSEHIQNAKVTWMLSKNGAPVSYTGVLTDEGGSISISDTGEFALTSVATDRLGRESRCTQKITVTNTAPQIFEFTVTPTRTAKDGKFLVNISATASDQDGDDTVLEWQGKNADGYYAVGAYTVKVRAKDTAGTYSQWVEKSFTVENSAPAITNFTVTPTRTAKDGKFLVNISATASDQDGDDTVLEWQGKNADGYYAVGTYIVKVRARDTAGAYSEWVEKSFTVANSAPTRPVITRTPNGNSVAPGTPVTITAQSTDPDGDTITYVWENRPSETSTYSLGKNVVRVKAVDSTGAESPWSAIVFFVADSNGSGGMTLTGPDSTILENGIEGATITKYTFTVPPVSGHSGNDFGRVKGYNILTKQWEQLDYGTTSNGITFERSLTSGIYSKLEFYYYTNHNCMYNKSNITYSVEYFFE